MRVYAIVAHSKKESMNGHFFYQVVSHMKSEGHVVDVLDLYDRADQIPFFGKHVIGGTQRDPICHPFFIENKERFMAADRLFIEHPIYWYSVPGILKTWMDLLTNFAWKYEGGLHAKPLHKIKKTLVVNSSSAPLFYRKYLTSNPAKVQLRETFKFIGIPESKFYEIGSVTSLTLQDGQRHVEKINEKTHWLCS
ncbi:MAG: NAD(P)H-dependent oxidoreductase [Candidatus Babeliales bacterium]